MYWQQAIHPNQVEIIQSTFVPTAQGKHGTIWHAPQSRQILSEIQRAAKIMRAMIIAHNSQKGAVGLEGIMIDAPMIKQVARIAYFMNPRGWYFYRQRRLLRLLGLRDSRFHH